MQQLPLEFSYNPEFYSLDNRRPSASMCHVKFSALFWGTKKDRTRTKAEGERSVVFFQALNTVDGSEIRLTSWGWCPYPIIYRVYKKNPRWLFGISEPSTVWYRMFIGGLKMFLFLWPKRIGKMIQVRLSIYTQWGKMIHFGRTCLFQMSQWKTTTSRNLLIRWLGKDFCCDPVPVCTSDPRWLRNHPLFFFTTGKAQQTRNAGQTRPCLQTSSFPTKSPLFGSVKHESNKKNMTPNSQLSQWNKMILFAIMLWEVKSFGFWPVDIIDSPKKVGWEFFQIYGKHFELCISPGKNACVWVSIISWPL